MTPRNRPPRSAALVRPEFSNRRADTTVTPTPAAAARSRAVGPDWTPSGGKSPRRSTGGFWPTPVQCRVCSSRARRPEPTRIVMPTIPWCPGTVPVPSDVRLVDVLDGKPAVSGPASGRLERNGASAAYRSSNRAPSPSMRSRPAARTGGITIPSRPPGSPSAPIRAGSTSANDRSPYRGRTGSGEAGSCPSKGTRSACHDRGMVEAVERVTPDRSGPSDVTLPEGLRVVVDRHVVALDGGRVLLGGAPPRMLRLTPAGRALLVGGGFAVADPTSRALARRLLDGGIVHPVPEANGPGPEHVTVVVPVKDRTGAVARLLSALPTDLGGVIVVDDGSADPDALRAVAGKAGARVLRHARPRGPAAARNAGLAEATTPLVAFLDSDVLPTPGWLEPLLAHLADPAVGLVAPRIVALPPVRGWLGRYEAVRSSLDLGPDPAVVVPRTRVAYVPSAAMLVRRAAAGAGFDDDMHVAEDVDLVLRLHATGWRLRYEPTSRVAHDHRTGLRAWWLRKAYYGTGAAPLALRHRGAVPPMVLSPWAAAVAGALLARRPLVAAGVAAWAVQRLVPQLPELSRPWSAAARIVGLGVVGAVAQTADAVDRHYWPLAALACAVSARARRTVATVALAEGVADWVRHRDPDPSVRPG